MSSYIGKQIKYEAKRDGAETQWRWQWTDDGSESQSSTMRRRRDEKKMKYWELMKLGLSYGH